MSSSPLSIVPGTVAFLALGALAHGNRMHGFQILRWIQEVSDGELLVEEGALYPQLHRMEKNGWIEAEWAVSEKGRRAKYYTITPTGRTELAKEERSWGRYVVAVQKVMTREADA